MSILNFCGSCPGAGRSSLLVVIIFVCLLRLLFNHLNPANRFVRQVRNLGNLGAGVYWRFCTFVRNRSLSPRTRARSATARSANRLPRRTSHLARARVVQRQTTRGPAPQLQSASRVSFNARSILRSLVSRFISCLVPWFARAPRAVNISKPKNLETGYSGGAPPIPIDQGGGAPPRAPWSPGLPESPAAPAPRLPLNRERLKRSIQL